MRLIKRWRRSLGAGLMICAFVFSLTTASAGPGYEEDVELFDKTVHICVRANINNRCWPVTFK